MIVNGGVCSSENCRKKIAEIGSQIKSLPLLSMRIAV